MRNLQDFASLAHIHPVPSENMSEILHEAGGSMVDPIQNDLVMLSQIVAVCSDQPPAAPAHL